MKIKYNENLWATQTERFDSHYDLCGRITCGSGKEIPEE